MSAPERFDVLVVGAGLSGIGAACHLQRRRPGRSFAILEARERIGGTWDLFRYPGVRSDSDMYTMGYRFRPWEGGQAIAEGAAIREYIQATAREHGLERHIRFRHRVTRAAWSSADAAWTVDVEAGEERRPLRFTCSFLFACTGYYDYAGGYTPELPGRERFRGRVVHPQHWPPDLDWSGQRVVVIGSGATAVTLVPALAARAARVTLVQRSPTYVVSRAADDAFAAGLRRVLPAGAAATLARWRSVLLQIVSYRLLRRFPGAGRRELLRRVARELPGFDVARHFSPRHAPWDERLCVVPDGDLFAALRGGRVEMATEEIDGFSEGGLRLRSGREVPADVVVTATGLVLRLLGGAEIWVDGAPVDLARTLAYKGVMLSGVPNLALALGYTHASWTLKVELAAEWVCRLLNHMQAKGYATCVPRRDGRVAEEPLLDLQSGYIRRASATLPRQGARRPWRLFQNYVLDLLELRHRGLEDGVLHFSPSLDRAPGMSSTVVACSPGEDP